MLVVDDDPAAARLLRHHLERAGHVVCERLDGQGALAELERGDVDVLVTDLVMPDMDGIELLDRARRLLPHLEVILTTAQPTLERAIQGLRRGASDLLCKPVEPSALVHAVQRAAHKRRMQRATELNEVTRAIFSHRDPATLPQAIADVVGRVLRADDVSLMLPGPGGRLHVAYSTAATAPHWPVAGRPRNGSGIAERVANSGQPALIVGDPGEDPRFRGARGHGRVASSIVYPLRVGERTLGVLNLNRATGRVPFSPADLERVGVIAGPVVLALENARLVRRAASSERLAAIGQIAAGLAHEINSPAACVLGHLSLAETELEELEQQLLELPAEQIADFAQRLEALRASVGEAAAAAGQLRSIADGMRCMSRNRAGDRSLLELNDVVRTALRVARYELHRHAAEIETHWGEGTAVLGQAGRLAQVFLNLLVNAAHALASVPADRRRVRIRTERVGNEVIAEVADTGPGVPEPLRARVFEAFFTTKPEGLGTGLGLSICAEIVHQHGGAIELDSSPG
ncbi:MAG: response regulator, partial [Planctomycetota bacterium]